MVEQLDTKELMHGIEIIQKLIGMLPEWYQEEEIRLLIADSDKKCKESFGEEESINIETSDCDGFSITETNTIAILYYKPCFRGQNGDIYLIFTLLHELRHLYQAKVMKVTSEIYDEANKDYWENEYEKDANKFAYDFIEENETELCKLIGCNKIHMNRY